MVLTEDGSLLRTYGQAGHATQLHDPNLCHEWAFTHPFALVLTRPAIQARFASVRSQFKGAEKLMLPEWAEDPRYKEKYLPNAQEEFSSMDHAYFLSRPFYGGHFLVHEVNAHNNTISGALGVPKDYAVYNTVARLGHKALQPPPHPHHAYNPDDDDTAYYPSFVIGRRFGVSSLTISRLASSMIFDNPYFKTKSDRSSFVLGLSLKVDAKNLRVPGYTFKNENGWAYSRKAVGLFEQYFHSFKPDLLILDKLFTSKSSNSTRTFTTLENLVDAGLTLKRLGQISTFVSKLLVSNSVPSLESANNQYFTDSQLRWLQTSPSLKSNHRRRNDPNSPTASSKPPTNIPYYVIKKRNVRCQAVLKPSDNRLRLTNQVFDLGDYVKLINNEGLLLPPGVCGYVVGLNYDMGSAKIFWDTAMYNYVGGSKKNDNDKLIGLSDLLDIDFVCLLNLSNRQYFVE
ncbi:5'-3' exoribonuclease 1 [Zancudomyces culisetae]|uniref:5'-3' exoribonuclease 1 n=1 Tax=Zancudomyces culisetae TaxID=1213189 RepID=A0A1R1PM38_ZANCU|nr:5'-3' exoribonuclease 1 [Zancudomyces culisetae]|eukprot:OMH82041.1 5'-3' exoribonuclease 1 [Zancudomyces culisetae]